MTKRLLSLSLCLRLFLYGTDYVCLQSRFAGAGRSVGSVGLLLIAIGLAHVLLGRLVLLLLEFPYL